MYNAYILKYTPLHMLIYAYYYTCDTCCLYDGLDGSNIMLDVYHSPFIIIKYMKG